MELWLLLQDSAFCECRLSAKLCLCFGHGWGKGSFSCPAWGVKGRKTELEGVVRQSSVLWQAACLLLLYTKELQLAVPCLKQGSLYKLQNGLQIVLLFFHWCIVLSHEIYNGYCVTRRAVSGFYLEPAL